MAIDYAALNATIVALPVATADSTFTPVDITDLTDHTDDLMAALVQESKTRFPDDDAGTFNQPDGTPKIKVNLSTNPVSSARYDRVLNVGAMQAVVDAFRSDLAANPPG